MSSPDTSLPLFSATFSYRMRDPLFLSSWWKCTWCSRTAVYAFTGTLTRPKLIDPDHTDRGMAVPLPAGAGTRTGPGGLPGPAASSVLLAAGGGLLGRRLPRRGSLLGAGGLRGG